MSHIACLCLCVGRMSELCKNGSTDWNAIVGADSCGSKKPCIRRWVQISIGRGTFKSDVHCRPIAKYLPQVSGPAQRIWWQTNAFHCHGKVASCQITLLTLVIINTDTRTMRHTISSQKWSSSIARLFLSRLIIHRPPSRFLASSHIGWMPSCRVFRVHNTLPQSPNC